MLSTLRDSVLDRWKSRDIKFLIHISFVRCDVCSAQQLRDYNVVVTPDKMFNKIEVSVTPKNTERLSIITSPIVQEDKKSTEGPLKEKFDIILLGLEETIVPLVNVTVLEEEEEEDIENKVDGNQDADGWTPVKFDVKVAHMEDIFKEEGMNLPMTPFSVAFNLNNRFQDAYQIPEYRDDLDRKNGDNETAIASHKLSNPKVMKVAKIELADFSSILKGLKLQVDTSGDCSFL